MTSTLKSDNLKPLSVSFGHAAAIVGNALDGTYNAINIQQVINEHAEQTRSNVRQAGLKLECANGYLNSRAALCFVDSSKHDQFTTAQEQQEFARAEFMVLLETVTGLNEAEFRRILS